MKRHHSLFEKIVTFENLLLAAKKAMRGKKLKAPVAKFYFHLEKEVIRLERELSAGTYCPGPFHQFEIHEPKLRTIHSSVFSDRVVHNAICNVIEPIFERRLIADSYACRHGKGTHSAVKRVQEFSRRYDYFLKCDVKKYFESIDHVALKMLLRRLFKDRRLLSLLDLIIDHQPPSAPHGKGIPIGNLTSQHFANFYLGELDHFIKERLGRHGYVRYMDDFICFAHTKEELHETLFQIREFLEHKLRLQLKEKVVRIAPVTEGVPFLGFRIFRETIRLQRANLVRVRRKIRERENQYQRGIISDVELVQSVNSMIAHMAHANSMSVRRKDMKNSSKLA